MTCVVIVHSHMRNHMDSKYPSIAAANDRIIKIAMSEPRCQIIDRPDGTIYLRSPYKRAHIEIKDV